MKKEEIESEINELDIIIAFEPDHDKASWAMERKVYLCGLLETADF